MQRIGDDTFGIVYEYEQFFEQKSFLALARFGYCVKSEVFGCRTTSMMGCTLDAVERAIARRGEHLASCSAWRSAFMIAAMYRNHVYGDETMQVEDISDYAACLHEIHTNDVVLAPDGDEAFDCGSYVLIFDVDAAVRVIAFQTEGSGSAFFLPANLQEVWVPADHFYGVLDEWRIDLRRRWQGFLASGG
jgi:hypothetical protein